MTEGTNDEVSSSSRRKIDDNTVGGEEDEEQEEEEDHDDEGAVQGNGPGHIWSLALHVAKKSAAREPVAGASMKATNYLEETGNMYIRKIEVVLQKIREIDRKIKVCQANTRALKQSGGSSNRGSHPRSQQTSFTNSVTMTFHENNKQHTLSIPLEKRNTKRKRVCSTRSLDDKLDKAKRSVSQLNCENNTLRREINRLRVARTAALRQGVEEKAAMNNTRENLIALKESIKCLQEQTETTQQELQTLQQQEHQQETSFQSMLAELERKTQQIEQEGCRSHGRHERGTGGDGTGGAEGRGVEGLGVDGVQGRRQQLKRQSVRLRWHRAKAKNDLERRIVELKEMQRAFDTIRKRTGVNDIDVLVKQFIDSEETIVRRVTALQDLNRALMKATTTRKQLQAELDKYKRNEDMSSMKKQRISNVLAQNIKTIKEQLHVINQNIATDINHLQAVRPVLYRLLRQVKCKDKMAFEMLMTENVSNSKIIYSLPRERSN